MKCERCNDKKAGPELDGLCKSCHDHIFQEFSGTMMAYDDVDDMGQM